jgi:hypothetical protein
VVYHRAGHITERATFPHFPTYYLRYAISQQLIIQVQTNEARIILAIEAIRLSRKISIRTGTKLYNIPKTTLSYRMAGRTPRSETKANCHKLTELEEEVIIQMILDMDTRGFAPRLASIKDIANYILESRGGRRVGKLWAHRFV